MSGQPLRIALVGGVPPSLGSGGLELQVERTAGALRRRGYDVFHVAQEPGARPFDVLHAFSSGPDVAHWLAHWRRSSRAPLVVSPVLVVPPGQREWRQRIAHRLPIPEFGPWQRRILLRRAAVVVALTEHEATLLRRLVGRAAEPIAVVPNGVDPVGAPTGTPPSLPPGYVALAGTVSRRKRQYEAVLALAAAGGPPPVVLGGLEGPADDREAFAAAVARGGGVWLGEVDDAAMVRHVIRGAAALVHLSAAEGQSLAVLEALAEGTPVVAAALGSNRELAHRYPGHVRLVAGEEGLAGALASLRGGGSKPLPIPTWDEVAGRLEQVYRQAGARWSIA